MASSESLKSVIRNLCVFASRREISEICGLESFESTVGGSTEPSGFPNPCAHSFARETRTDPCRIFTYCFPGRRNGNPGHCAEKILMIITGNGSETLGLDELGGGRLQVAKDNDGNVGGCHQENDARR